MGFGDGSRIQALPLHNVFDETASPPEVEGKFHKLPGPPLFADVGENHGHRFLPVGQIFHRRHSYFDEMASVPDHHLEV